MHGEDPDGSVNGQPAIMKVSVVVSAGAPPACTDVADGVAVTVPPCGHISVLAVVSKPGIRE
jgi:hypothetical protein